jgi:hypothetical protein
VIGDFGSLSVPVFPPQVLLSVSTTDRRVDFVPKNAHSSITEVPIFSERIGVQQGCTFLLVRHGPVSLLQAVLKLLYRALSTASLSLLFPVHLEG